MTLGRLAALRYTVPLFVMNLPRFLGHQNIQQIVLRTIQQSPSTVAIQSKKPILRSLHGSIYTLKSPFARSSAGRHFAYTSGICIDACLRRALKTIDFFEQRELCNGLVLITSQKRTFMSGITTLSSGGIMPSHESTPKNKHTELIQLWESTKEWKNLSYWDQVNAIEFFMSDIASLYLNYFQYHLEEAKKCAHELESLIKEGLPLINHQYVMNQEHEINNADAYDDPWIKACQLRTNVAAFETMFGEIAGNLEADGVKEYINNKKGYVTTPPSSIPFNTPKEHWWWFETVHYGDEKS